MTVSVKVSLKLSLKLSVNPLHQTKYQLNYPSRSPLESPPADSVSMSVSVGKDIRISVHQRIQYLFQYPLKYLIQYLSMDSRIQIHQTIRHSISLQQLVTEQTKKCSPSSYPFNSTSVKLSVYGHFVTDQNIHFIKVYAARDRNNGLQWLLSVMQSANGFD